MGCPHELLVEAARDGLLGVEAASAVREHVATCPACARLWVDLERLRALARCSVPPQNPLEARRARLRLLGSAVIEERAPTLSQRLRRALRALGFGV